MCVTSMIGDHFMDKWRPFPGTNNPYPLTLYPPGPSQKEFDELKKEVMEMKELLKRAKKYDEETGQKDCEMDEKVKFLKKVAESVGVSLEDIFK